MVQLANRSWQLRLLRWRPARSAGPPGGFELPD